MTPAFLLTTQILAHEEHCFFESLAGALAGVDVCACVHGVARVFSPCASLAVAVCRAICAAVAASLGEICVLC